MVISLSFAVFIRNGPNGCEKYDTRDASNPGDAWIPVSPADGNTVDHSCSPVPDPSCNFPQKNTRKLILLPEENKHRVYIHGAGQYRRRGCCTCTTTQATKTSGQFSFGWK